MSTAMTTELPVAVPPQAGPVLRGLFWAGHERETETGAKRAVRSLAWAAFTTVLVTGNPAVQGQRLACGSRFWRAQVLRRRKATYEADLGAAGRLLCPPWSAIGAVTAATGTHEPADQTFVARFVRAGDVVLDVGANIGFYAVPLALQGAIVACFEPAPATLDVLRDNIARNAIADRTVVFDCALADFDGTASFTVDRDAENCLVVNAAEEANRTVAQTRVRKLDSLAQEHPELFAERSVTLAKVDAEGFDEQVLAGATDVIDRHRPVVMVEIRRGGGRTRELLEAHGYVACFYDLARQQLVRLPANYAGDHTFHMNMIAVPEERVAAVQQRLAECPPPVFTARVRPL